MKIQRKLDKILKYFRNIFDVSTIMRRHDADIFSTAPVRAARKKTLGESFMEFN